MGGLSDANLHLTERLTRTSPTTLVYEVTVDDPTVWTQPWTTRFRGSRVKVRSSSTPVTKGTTASTTSWPGRLQGNRMVRTAVSCVGLLVAMGLFPVAGPQTE